MLGFGEIEIEEATWTIGMLGRIVFQRKKDGAKFRITNSSHKGLQAQTWDGVGWFEPKDIDTDYMVAMLPKNRRWTLHVFLAVWAGFAEGYRQGKQR